MSSEFIPSTLLWQAATIVDDERGRRWLEFPSISSCARCRSGQGCGAAQWSRLFGDRSGRGAQRLPLPENCPLPAGSPVRAGVSSRALLRAATLAYLVPLLAFVLTLAGLDALGLHEPLVLLCGLGISLMVAMVGRNTVRRGLVPTVEPAAAPCDALETRAG